MTKSTFVSVVAMVIFMATSATAVAHRNTLSINAKLHKSESLINWYQHKGHWTLHPAHKTCWSVIFMKERQRCIVARRNVRWHEKRIERLRRHLEAVKITVASTSWYASTELVRRYFGDEIANWEWSCSDTEGGHGGFVWYGHYDHPIYGPSNTPGGNLQFKGGTFWGIIDKAITTARSRGLSFPASARDFTSPLGQAVAGAQMILDGRVGEWTGSGC